MRDIFVAKVKLDGSRVLAGVCQKKGGGVPQHVGTDRKFDAKEQRVRAGKEGILPLLTAAS